MKLPKRVVPGIIVSVAMLSASGIVYALNNNDFSDKAQSWATKNCTQELLNKKSGVEHEKTSALCFSILETNKNSAELNTLKATLNEGNDGGFIYSLINVDTHNGMVEDTIASTVVPVKSVISNLTILAKSGADKVIDSGRVDVILTVNGQAVDFGTYLDKDLTSNNNSSGEIHVEAGDKVQVKLKSSEDIWITGAYREPCNPTTPVEICSMLYGWQLDLNVGVYLKAE